MPNSFENDSLLLVGYKICVFFPIENYCPLRSPLHSHRMHVHQLKKNSQVLKEAFDRGSEVYNRDAH